MIGADRPRLARPGVPARFAGPAAFPRPEAGPVPPGLIQRILGSYAIMLTVPIAEMLIVYLHAHIPVVVIADLILTFALITSGRANRFWETPMAKPWCAALVLYSFAAVFGFYKGASIPFVFQYGIRFHVLPFYCCALAFSSPQVRHVLRWMGWGTLLLVLLCAKFGVSEEGRFLLPSTSLENPNDLALAFLFTVPCLLLNASKLSRVIAWLTVPLVVVYILKTGSRASLVTMVALVFVLFVLSPPSKKALLLLGLPVCVALVMAVVPSYTLQRLTLIVAKPDNMQLDGQLKGAVDSQEARTELQKRAIELALHRPLFGVGANEFADGVEDMVRKATGQKSGWQGAHNTYLQVAAENGIPAMILYTWTLFLCAKMNFQTYRLCRRDPLLAHATGQSLALILITVAFTVCIAFDNNAYDPRVGLLVGLTAANYLAIRDEVRGRTQAAQNVRQTSPFTAVNGTRVVPRRAAPRRLTV